MLRTGEKGSALIAVLWLTAALGAILFLSAASVRADIDRSLAGVEGERAYYLAEGSIDRALLHLHWGEPLRSSHGMRLQYPDGEVLVEIIPESTKQNLNTISPEALFRLLVISGTQEAQARAIAGNLHLPLTNPEELLRFGVSPDVFFGHYRRGSEARDVWQAGIRDQVTTTGADNIYTLRATAYLKQSHMKRTVAALVRMEQPGRDPFYTILRWYNNAQTGQVYER